MIKVMTIFGTRPEAIKMAPVVKELLKRPGIDTKVCLTAQHREMLDQVVDLFHLPVDYDLDIMKSGQSLYDITARVLRGLEDVLKKEKPEARICFVGPCAAKKLEASRRSVRSEVDFVLTFEELMGLFEA